MKKVLVFGVAILLGFSSCLTAARRDYDRFVESLPEVSGTVFQNVHYSDKGKQCVLDIFWPEGDLCLCSRRGMAYGIERIYPDV